MAPLGRGASVGSVAGWADVDAAGLEAGRTVVEVSVDSPRRGIEPLGALFRESLFCVPLVVCVVVKRFSSSRVRSRCAMVASSKVSVRRRFCSSSESLDCWLTTSFSSSTARITFAARLTQSLASAASSTA